MTTNQAEALGGVGMTIWVVMTGDAEGASLVSLCSTKELAEKSLFEQRDELTKEWNRMADYMKEQHGNSDQMYHDMIKALSSDDYESWDNYPFECPHLFEKELVEK